MSRSNEALSVGMRLGWPLLTRVKSILTADAIVKNRRFAPRKLHVLVAEDNPIHQRLVSEMLLSLGIQPLLAADGTEAVALARERRLDFILMDIQMPELDGLGATRMIRQHEAEVSRARVPVVGHTSISAHAARLHESGMDGVLQKPCKVSALHECLAHWCASDEREVNFQNVNRLALPLALKPGILRI